MDFNDAIFQPGFRSDMHAFSFFMCFHFFITDRHRTQ